VFCLCPAHSILVTVLTDRILFSEPTQVCAQLSSISFPHHKTFPYSRKPSFSTRGIYLGFSAHREDAVIACPIVRLFPTRISLSPDSQVSDAFQPQPLANVQLKGCVKAVGTPRDKPPRRSYNVANCVYMRYFCKVLHPAGTRAMHFEWATMQQQEHKAAAFVMDSMHPRQMTGSRKVASTKLCPPTLLGTGLARIVPEIPGRCAGKGEKNWLIRCHDIRGGRTDLEVDVSTRLGTIVKSCPVSSFDCLLFISSGMELVSGVCMSYGSVGFRFISGKLRDHGLMIWLRHTLFIPCFNHSCSNSSSTLGRCAGTLWKHSSRKEMSGREKSTGKGG